MELIPEELAYLGPQDLTQYFIRWLQLIPYILTEDSSGIPT